jgi:two-component system cell cycle response regulator
MVMSEVVGAPGRVLVVADSRVARARLVAQLAPHGFALTESNSGEEAIAAAAAEAPDVILLDVELPGEDAFELLDKLKAAGELSHIPVVFISQRTSTEDVADGLERGAHDYLRKPVEPSELIARVMGAVRLKELQDQLRQANDELRLTAGTDSLTGLPNRRMAGEHLERLLARARRHSIPFVVVLVDLDGFKAINDRHGHAIGDLALIAVAERMEAVCRSGDLLGRWGGDELIVLSTEAEEGDAGALAARLVASVGDEALDVEGVRLDLEISAGWTVWRDGDVADAILARADRSLYAAKAGGGGVASG